MRNFSRAIQRGFLMRFGEGSRFHCFLKRHIFSARERHRLIHLRRVQYTLQKVAEEVTERRKFFPLGDIVNARKFKHFRVLALFCQTPSLSGYDDWIFGSDGEQYGCRNCRLIDRLVGGS